MFTHFPSMGRTALLFSSALLLPSIACAANIPSIDINYAAGFACWGATCPNGTTEFAAFSGPGFTLSFATYDSGSGSPYAFSAQAGDPFPAGYFDGRFSQGTSSQNNYLSGTFTSNGQTYDVGYQTNPYVEILGSATVPNGYGTLVFPALLTGGGVACSGGLQPSPGQYSCDLPPGQMPAFIANVNFDVAGLLTVRFSPTTQPLYPSGSEYFVATFIASPEPASLWLAASGLLLTLAMLARRSPARRP